MTLHIHITHLLRRKPLVLAAILSMALSAILSYFCVNQHNREIAELHQQAEQMDRLIHDHWYDAGQIYHNIDAAVIISLLTKGGTKEEDAIRQEYFSRLKAPSGKKSLVKMLQATDQIYQEKTNAIDDIYIKKTALEEQSMALEHKNMLYANIAFLLQIIGLVLVIITRDLPDSA